MFSWQKELRQVQVLYKKNGFIPHPNSKFQFDLERTVTFERVPRELFGVSWVTSFAYGLVL